MRLTDIMSAAGLSGWAEAALILFFVAFCAIVIRIFWPSRRRELESRKHLPFADDESADPVTGGKRP